MRTHRGHARRAGPGPGQPGGAGRPPCRRGTVRFGWSPVADVAAAAEALQAINRLPGVRDVNRERDQVAIRGGREVIAHVGACLSDPVAPCPPISAWTSPVWSRRY